MLLIKLSFVLHLYVWLLIKSVTISVNELNFLLSSELICHYWHIVVYEIKHYNILLNTDIINYQISFLV